ncbi:MAG TPA: SBBP repeat-containing protein, partial [Blastocatellia bacterium]
MLRKNFYRSRVFNSSRAKLSRHAECSLAVSIVFLFLADVAFFPAMLRCLNPSMTANSQIVAREQTINEKARQSFNRLPLSFEANCGQFDADVKFVSRAGGYNLFLTPTEAVIEMRNQKSEVRSQEATGNREQVTDTEISHLSPVTCHLFPTLTTAFLRMKFDGANPDSRISGAEELTGKVNYFTGNDPARWRADVPTFAKVRYEEIYPGIDLVYYGNQREIEYDFILQPGARPEDIRLDFEGAKRLEIDPQGDLILQTEAGEIKQHRPFIYQIVDGEKQQIGGGYVIESESRVSFDVGEYDRNSSLIIDPTLAYSTYLGSSGEDVIFDVAVDSEGNIYATGFTNSTSFPVNRALQPTLDGSSDAFVLKLNPSGTALEYCTYLGGSGEENGDGIAVDNNGNVYVIGLTTSTDFPVANALQPSYGGGRFAG